MVPNGRSRPRRDRASSENASLQAGRIGSLTPPPARASSATRGCAARPLGEERVEPVDRELDVVRIGLAQAPDPVGQAPQRVVAGRAFACTPPAGSRSTRGPRPSAPAPSAATPTSAERSSVARRRDRRDVVRAHDRRRAAANRRRELHVGEVERPAVAPVEQLHDADHARVVDQRHGQQRARQIAGPLRGGALEARIGCTTSAIASGLAGRERVARRSPRSRPRSGRRRRHPAGPAAARNTSRPVAASCRAIGRGGDADRRGRRLGDRTERRLVGRSARGGRRRPAGSDARRGRRAPATGASVGIAAVARRSSGCRGEPARVRHDQLIALEPQDAPGSRDRRAAGSPTGGSHRSCPPAPPACTATAGGPRRSAACPRPGRASISGAAGAGQAARQVEEVEVLHLRRQAADLAGQRGEQRPRGSRRSRRAVDRTRPVGGRASRSPERLRRRRPRRPVEQRQLAEEPARPDRRQDRRLGAVFRRRPGS